MKTVTFFICFMGSAFAIPTYPLMYKLGIRGQRNSEKINFRFMPDNSQFAAVSEKQHIEKTFSAKQNIAVAMLNDSLVASEYETFKESQLPSNGSNSQVPDTTSEASHKRKTDFDQYMKRSDDLLSIQGSSDREEQTLTMNNEDKDEHKTAHSHAGNSRGYPVESSSGNTDFLAQEVGPTPSSDIQSDFRRSIQHQPDQEQYPHKSNAEHSNMASQEQDGQENFGQDLTVGQEQDMWKYNKHPDGLSENSEDNEEMEEEETEEWDETSYRERRQQAHVKVQDLYRSEQNEDSGQSDEMLRDADQPLHITKRQDEEFEDADQNEGEEEENAATQYHKEEEKTILLTSTEQDQITEQKSEEGEGGFQHKNQSISDHNEVVERLNPQEAATYMKTSSVEDNSDDNTGGGTDSDEDDFDKNQKEATYHKIKQIQSNAHRRIGTEGRGEGKDEDESTVTSEMKDDQNANIKQLVHFDQDYNSHEPASSESEEHEKITSLVQRSMNTMQPMDNVKATGSSFNEDESSSDSNVKILLNPCRNFHCKRGKVCQTDEQGKLSCVCQDSDACPPTKEHEHVCGTDNKTYNGTCQLFSIKCKLEGTKMGHQLHMDYMGSCKYIPPCTDYEVDQFPLRMRDWLKNVLVQLYERDLDRSGFLSDKQRSKVKKIYQNEKRLLAGDHPLELLLHDFEKNYHMYVYPVHWQFNQLDQHPADRLLTRSELAPLRISLIPMEHCITQFFQECDADQDKHVSFIEWCHCFGIKEEDIDENLLF